MEVFVTPDGAGSKNGTSPGNAFGLAEFHAATLTGGDRARFSGLFSSPITLNHSKAGLTASGEHQAEVRKLFSGDQSLIKLQTSDITVEGFKLTESTLAAIEVSDASNTIIRDNEMELVNRYGVFYVSTNSAPKSDLQVYENSIKFTSFGGAHGADDCVIVDGGTGSFKDLFIRNNYFGDALHAAINVGVRGLPVQNLYVHDNMCKGEKLPYGRFIGTKAAVSNQFIARNWIEGMRAPSQLGGQDIRFYDNFIRDQRNVCHSANDDGCEYAYPELNSGVTYWGAGYAIGFNELAAGARAWLLNNTIDGTDGAALYGWKSLARLVIRNNIFCAIARKAGANASPPGAQTPHVDVPIWFKEIASTPFAEVDNNVFHPDGDIWNDEDNSSHRYGIQNLANSGNISAASLNLQMDPQLDERGKPAVPVAGAEIPDFVDPAGHLPADLQPSYGFADDWQWKSGGGKKRSAFWDIGASVSGNEEVPDSPGFDGSSLGELEKFDYNNETLAYNVPAGTKTLVTVLHTRAFDTEEITGLTFGGVAATLQASRVEKYINGFTSSSRVYVQNDPTIGAVTIAPQATSEATYLYMLVIPLEDYISDISKLDIVSQNDVSKVYKQTLTTQEDLSVVMSIACINSNSVELARLDASQQELINQQGDHSTALYGAVDEVKGQIDSGFKLTNNSVRTGALFSFYTERKLSSAVVVAGPFSTKKELSNPGIEKTGDDSADITIDTTGDDGEIAVVVDEGGGSSTDQTMDGQNAGGETVVPGKRPTLTVSSAGQQTLSVNGLENGKLYYVSISHDYSPVIVFEYIHQDASFVSNIVYLTPAESGYCS